MSDSPDAHGPERHGLGVGHLEPDVAVVLHARAGRDQLADDDVLLEPEELVALALDGGLGQHPGRLLEGGGREPALGGQRRLGDAHELGTALGGRLAVLDQRPVDLGVDLVVDALAGQERRIARLGDQHPAQHLAHDQLDVLVVDRHTLVPVDLLDLFDQVLLGLADALDLEEFLGVLGPFDQRVTGGDLLAVGDLEVGPRGHQRGVLLPSSATTVMRRPVSSSLIRTTPEWWASTAAPLGVRASKSSTTRGRPWVMSSPTTPPVWKVRMVSWVPGSPIDWAAMTPTASPSSIMMPVASDSP